MSIINSSTTGHSAKQERKFSNKLFLGLIIAIGVAMVIFFFIGQRKDMSSLPQGQNSLDTNSNEAPLPTQEQPKN